ncbi:MAG: hypothetical protein MJ252_07640 [archaeon]|nr:hypothetical protein [archaeon]
MIPDMDYTYLTKNTQKRDIFKNFNIAKLRPTYSQRYKEGSDLENNSKLFAVVNQPAWYKLAIPTEIIKNILNKKIKKKKEPIPPKDYNPFMKEENRKAFMEYYGNKFKKMRNQTAHRKREENKEIKEEENEEENIKEEEKKENNIKKDNLFVTRLRDFSFGKKTKRPNRMNLLSANCNRPLRKNKSSTDIYNPSFYKTIYKSSRGKLDDVFKSVEKITSNIHREMKYRNDENFEKGKKLGMFEKEKEIASVPELLKDEQIDTTEFFNLKYVQCLNYDHFVLMKKEVANLVNYAEHGYRHCKCIDPTQRRDLFKKYKELHHLLEVFYMKNHYE